MVRNFLYKLTGSGEKIGQYKGRYIRIFIITSFIFRFVYFLPAIEMEKENLRYLLSAIPQSLAAVFALVVTISLVLTQLVFARMPNMAKRFLELEFPPSSMLFFAFFIFSIIFPLLLLAHNGFASSYIKLSLIFTTICLYGTVEYALGFKQKIEMLSNPS